MAPQSANTQDGRHRLVTWAEVYDAAKEVANRILSDMDERKLDEALLYGIPRGGIYAAQAVVAQNPSRLRLTGFQGAAHYFVDDILETGRTLRAVQEKWSLAEAFVLFDRNDPGLAARLCLSAPNQWLVFPWEQMTFETGPTENVRRILQYVGEDPDREGLVETPQRVVRSWDELYGGYHEDPASHLKVFEDDTSDEMVLLKGIEMYSTCEHHMLPFHGVAHIAYIPQGKVVGISKLARILEVYARRLQIQERLCQQITALLDTELGAKGSACVIEAQHFCMTSRGVKKQGSKMVTSSLTGVFRTGTATRAELFQLIHG